MSIRSVAFFVSAASVPLTVNATLDTLTLADFDTSITIGSAQNIIATLDTLSLVDLNATIVIGTPLLISATKDTMVIASFDVALDFTGTQDRAAGFFSF